jgi:hypothetical protein
MKQVSPVHCCVRYRGVNSCLGQFSFVGFDVVTFRNYISTVHLLAISITVVKF